MSLLIKNGRIVTAVDDYHADIFVENDTISVIGKNLTMEADEVIDALLKQPADVQFAPGQRGGRTAKR